jgi:nicotinamidase-related amidase
MEPDVALLVVDMLNPYEHEDAEALARSVEATIEPFGELIARAREDERIELIWVNDNYEDFAATREDLVAQALDGSRPDLVEPVLPPDGVPFLQKVRHSAFYGTSLDHHLRRRAIGELILTGQVTEQCILYTALDAYVRHYRLTVVRDAVAHIDQQLGDAAVRMMESNMRARITAAKEAL